MSEEVKATESSAVTTAVADGWDEQGTPIVTKKPEAQKPAEKSLPSKDASAASTPATKSGKEPGPGPGKKERDEERNWRALESDRDGERQKREAAEKELDEWRSGRKKPEASTEKQEATAPKLLEQPKRPRMTDFVKDGNVQVEKYEEAVDKYEADRAAYETEQQRIRYASQEQQRMLEKWSSDVKAKYGDKSSGLDVKKTVDALVSTVKDAPAFAAFLNDSELFTDLLFVLGTDPKLPEILEEAKKSPTKAIRRLVLIEEGVRAEIAKGSDKDHTKEPPKAEKKPDEPKPRAPKPPSEVGGRGASTEDAAVAAAKDSNFSAFDAEQRRRYMRAS